MVHLVTTASAFEGRVLAARLGSEGIVVTLRGAVDGPYPFGEVFVDVDESQLSLARQLLLADEVEAVFAPAGGEARRRPVQPWAIVVLLVLLAATVVGSLVRFVAL
jgi:hypothetical protein